MLFAYLFAVLLLLFFTGNIVVYVFSLVFYRVKKLINQFYYKFSRKFISRTSAEYEGYLAGRFLYYENLSPSERTRFILRIRKFIDSKNFEGRKGVEVTEEMKVLIAASAVQLTFGLKNFVLDYFSRIIVYPEAYLSPVTGKYHKGEANIRGALVISWKDFIAGYDNPNDTYNVGLHEMAHALELENHLGGEYDFYFVSYYEKWKMITEKEYENVSDGGESFFRKYAGTNRHEFFAVSIEHFFEASVEFRRRLPQVYYHLSILLNQDPLNYDYKITPKRRMSRDELLNNGLTSAEIMETNVSTASLFSSLLFSCAILLLIYFLTNGQLLPVLMGGFLLSFFTIFPSVFFIRKAVLYEKYLGFKTIFGKLKFVYSLEDLVSVDFNPEKSGQSANLLILRNGQIYRVRHALFTGKDQINRLKTLLVAKGVLVRK